MSPLLALRLVTYLTVADGIAALLLADLIAPLGAGLVGAAVLASWWLERARERGAVTQALSWVLVGLAAVALTVDLLYLAATVLDGMVHVLLFVILARLIMCRSLRDLRDAGFLSFFLLVATASVTFSMAFLAVFVAYLALATWMMMLNHIVTESDQAGRRDLMVTRLGLRGQMIRVSLAAAAGTFVIAGILFFLIPRVEQATLPLRAQFSRMVTGFSERVDLGSFGDIETDKTVVMRVQFPDAGIDPPALPNLRWRGIVFDTFDGRAWSVGRPTRRLVARGPGGQFLVGTSRGRGPVVRQEVFLDPIGTDIIFAAPRPLRLDLRAEAINADDMGTISVPTEAARLHYVVESELETAPPPGTRVSAAGAALPDQERRRFLQLPDLSPEIARLARDVTAGSRDPLEAANRLSLFLSTNYSYSLSKRETLGRSAPGFPLHPEGGQLRVLLGRARRHAPEPRYPGSRRRRISARRVEPLWPILHGAVRRRARLGRGVLRWARVDDVRSVAPRTAGASHGAVGIVAAARRRPHALVSLRRQLEPAGPAGDGRDRPAPGPGLPAGARLAERLGRQVLAHRRGGAARRGRARVVGLARSLLGRGAADPRACRASTSAPCASSRGAGSPPALPRRPASSAAERAPPHRSAPLPWPESPAPTSAPASGQNR